MIVRTWRDEDMPAILQLVRRSLGDGPAPRQEEFLRWKHLDNPFGRSIGLVAERDDAVLVGLRLFMRWRFVAGGESIEAVRAVDTATAPEVRGQGLFRELTLGALDLLRGEGIRLVFNTPNAQSRPGYLKMGWRLVTRVPVWVRPSRVKGLLEGLSAHRRMAQTPEPLAEAAVDLVTYLAGAAGLPVASNGEASERRLHTPRSREYLRWRYAAIPSLRYAVLAEDAASANWTICRARVRRRWLETSFSEVVVGDSASERALFAQRVRAACHRLPGDYLLATAASQSPEARALTAAGFWRLPGAGPHLTVRRLDPHPLPAAPEDWRSWRLSTGDLEIF